MSVREGGRGKFRTSRMLPSGIFWWAFLLVVLLLVTGGKQSQLLVYS